MLVALAGHDLAIASPANVESTTVDCREHSVVYLDSVTGKKQVDPCDILDGACGGYTLVVPGTGTDTVDCTYAGKTALVQLTPPGGGSSFYCKVKVIDADAPALVCRDTFVSCDVDIFNTVPDSLGVTAWDACGIDTIYPLLCGSAPGTCVEDTLKTLKILWQAIDSSGNLSSCTQLISIIKPSLDDVVAPKDTILYCPDYDLDDLPGPLLFDSSEIGKNCGLIVSYFSIDTMVVCGAEKWISRHWSVLDLCTFEMRDSVQMINVVDTFGLEIECDTLLTLVIDESDLGCSKEYVLPTPEINRSCEGTAVTVSYIYEGARYEPESTISLDTGTHIIECYAIDECWNQTECFITVEVRDSLVLECPSDICQPITNGVLSSSELIAMDCKTIMDIYYPSPSLILQSPCCGLDTIECFKTVDNMTTTPAGDTIVVVMKYVAKDSCGNVSDTCYQSICAQASNIEARIVPTYLESQAISGKATIVPNPTSGDARILLGDQMPHEPEVEIVLRSLGGAVYARRKLAPVEGMAIHLDAQLAEMPPGLILVTLSSPSYSKTFRLLKQ